MSVDMGKSRLLYEFSKFQSWTTQGTLPSKRVPLVFREPGVLTGYRPCRRTWGYYLLSVFKLHNESINIWIHAIAGLVLFYKTLVFVNDYNSTGNDIYWLLAMDGVCVTVCSFLSAFAHTFHSKSLLHHYVCFQCDYIGTSLIGLGNSVLFFHTSCSDWFYEHFKRISLPVYVMAALYCTAGSSIVKLRYKRPYPKQRKLFQIIGGLIQAVFGLFPIVAQYINCIQNAECSLSSLNHHSVWIASVLGSAFFFSSHLPEKKYPGSFDFIGQGHQIFHVLVSTAEILVFDAVLYEAGVNGLRPVDKDSIRIALVTYFFGCFAIIACLYSFTVRRVKQDEKDQ